MPNPRLILVVETDGGLLQPYPLPSGQKITIGSAPDNRVIIEDKSVSRRHAEIRYESGRITLLDLGSRNGTFVNGRRLERANHPVAIRIADGVEIGHCKLSFQEIDSSIWDTKTAISGILSLPHELQHPPGHTDISASFDLDSGHVSITRKGYTPLFEMIEHGFRVAAILELDYADDDDVAVVARCTGKRFDSWVRLCAGYVRSLDMHSRFDSICHATERWLNEVLSISFETPTVRLFASVTKEHGDDVSMISGDPADVAEVFQEEVLFHWLLPADVKSRVWANELLEWVQTNVDSNDRNEDERDPVGLETSFDEEER